MAKKDTWKPDADYIVGLKLLRESDGDEQTLRDRIPGMRDLVAMEHPVEIPTQYRKITREVRTPFVRDTCLRVTAALTQHPPVAHVEPTEERQEARASANVAERWTQAAISQMDESLGEHVVYEAVKALIRDEESFIKVVHRPDVWRGFPRRDSAEEPERYSQRVTSFKRASGLPFAWRPVDRLCLFPGWGEFGLADMLEYGEYPTLEMAGRYGMVRVKDQGLRDPENLRLGVPKPEGYLTTASAQVVKYEYWSDDWWAVVVDGEMAPGFPKPNPYPRIPYFGAKVSEPVLLALRDLVPALDALLTMKLNWSYLGAYPIPVIETAPSALGPDLPGGDDGQPTEVNWDVGKMLELPTGKNLKFLSPPPVGQDLNQLVMILRELIDIAGIPSVFRGQGGADQAGYAINQLIAAANLTYRILTSTAQRQLQEAARFLWTLTEKRIRQPVYVLENAGSDTRDGPKRKKKENAWLCLDPTGKEKGPNVAQTSHLAKLTYSFRPVLPTDEQSRAMIAMQLVNAPKPLSSQRHALEKWLQEEDPDSILDEAWAESAVNSPPVNERTVQEAFRRAGIGEQQPPNPAAQLVGPDGRPLLPGGGGAPSPYVPGQGASGMPSVPGLNQPMIPQAPGQPPIMPGQGGRPAGAFPGRPGGVPSGTIIQGP